MNNLAHEIMLTIMRTKEKCLGNYLKMRRDNRGSIHLETPLPGCVSSLIAFQCQ